MEPAIVSYLDKFEEKLRKELLQTATERHYLEGKLLESDDIKQYWHTIEPNYMADAVLQIADYKMAFYVFARACNAMFSIGASIELHRLGYKFEKAVLR